MTSNDTAIPDNSPKTVSALWLRGLLQAAESLGMPMRELLDAAGIPEAAISAPYARLSLQQNLRLWRVIEERSKVTDTGLRIGELVKPGHFQLFALTLMHSPDLGSAFTKSMRYTRLLSDGGQYHLDLQHGVAALCYEPQASDFSRHQVDAVLALLRNFTYWLACRSVPLLGVEMQHSAPGDISDYERIFNAPLTFNAPRNALLFDAQLMQEPLALGDEYLAQLHEQMLEAQLALLDQPDTAGLVRHFLHNADDLSIDKDAVAERLHMSSRTLQRKLQDSGTNFQQLLDEERSVRARQLLEKTKLPLTEISQQLGFAESSVFSRAFKRWHGIAPLEYRQRAQH